MCKNAEGSPIRSMLITNHKKRNVNLQNVKMIFLPFNRSAFNQYVM